MSPEEKWEELRSLIAQDRDWCEAQERELADAGNGEAAIRMLVRSRVYERILLKMAELTDR